jgi:hypothetical protein
MIGSTMPNCVVMAGTAVLLDSRTDRLKTHALSSRVSRQTMKPHARSRRMLRNRNRLAGQ